MAVVKFCEIRLCLVYMILLVVDSVGRFAGKYLNINHPEDY